MKDNQPSKGQLAGVALARFVFGLIDLFTMIVCLLYVVSFWRNFDNVPKREECFEIFVVMTLVWILMGRLRK